MQGDAVAPEGAAGGEEVLADRACQLGGGAPAGLGDLVRVLRGQLLRGGGRREDVRLPGHGLVREAEDGAGPDEVALELDLDPELLAALAEHACDEVLARLDAAPGRPPDALREVRLADQRQSLAVEDEQRHVVPPRRVVRDHRQLGIADLPVQSSSEGSPNCSRTRARTASSTCTRDGAGARAARPARPRAGRRPAPGRWAPPPRPRPHAPRPRARPARETRPGRWRRRPRTTPGRARRRAAGGAPQCPCRRRASGGSRAPSAPSGAGSLPRARAPPPSAGSPPRPARPRRRGSGTRASAASRARPASRLPLRMRRAAPSTPRRRGAARGRAPHVTDRRRRPRSGLRPLRSGRSRRRRARSRRPAVPAPPACPAELPPAPAARRSAPVSRRRRAAALQLPDPRRGARGGCRRPRS